MQKSEQTNILDALKDEALAQPSAEALAKPSAEALAKPAKPFLSSKKKRASRYCNELLAADLTVPENAAKLTTPFTFFASIKACDFRVFSGFCKIKHEKDQSSLLFSRDKWNDEQKAFFACSTRNDEFRNKNRWDIVLKPRQIGMSTMGALEDYFFALKYPGRDVMVVAQDEPTRMEILGKIRDAHDHLLMVSKKIGTQLVPEYATDNARTISFTNGSNIHSQVAKAQKTAAQKAGRGFKISRLHCTEVAFWSYPQDTMLSLLVASANALEILIESTPNGSSGWFHDKVQEHSPAKFGKPRSKEDAAWQLHFFPWYAHKAYRVPTLPNDFDSTPENKWEENLMKWHKCDEHQLAWWRQGVREFGIAHMLQEFACDLHSCFQFSGGVLFDEEDFHWLKENTSIPSWENLFGVPVATWEEPCGSSRYIIGVDTGYGRGKDSSTLCVIARDTGKIVATAASNTVDIGTFARVLSTLGDRYHGALIAVELAASGHGCVMALQDNEKYPNIYKDPKKPYYGWNTSSTSRPKMFYNIQSWIKDRTAPIPDASLIDELKNIVLIDNKPQAIKGANDDRVMAWAIALTVWHEAPMLLDSGYRSIKKNDISSDFLGRALGKSGKGYL